MACLDGAMRTALPVIEFAFPGPLRDKIVSAILSGAKTAASSLVREYELGGERMPAVGDRGAVIDSDGKRVAIIETTTVRIVPLRDVPVEHAVAEGEGYRSVADWRAGHTAFWTSAAMRAELGEDVELTDSTLIVLEQFVLEPV